MLPNLTQNPRSIRLFLAGHLILWLIFALTLQNRGPIHGDMLEAYFWGQNPQFGYYKHPPFWALATHLWFAIFPVANWAYLLLCSLNVTLGLAAIWLILGRYSTGPRRELAFLLLYLTPLYTFMAFQFNANTIFYSLWPWTLYFFLVSIEDAKPIAAHLFGVFSAMMMLSKYSAILLLLSCIIASCLHTRRTEYYRSSAPWITISTFLLLCLPHLVWLHQNGYQPITYVENKLDHALPFVLAKAFEFLTSLMAEFAFVILIIVLTVRSARSQKLVDLFMKIRAIVRADLGIIAFAPVLLFIISGVAVSIKLSVNLTNPFLFLIPLVLISVLSDAQIDALLPKLRTGIAIYLLAVLISVPAVSIALFKFSKMHSNEPLVELAEAAQNFWTMQTQAPFGIVTSSDDSSAALSFYAADHPLQWIDMNYKKSPWITSQLICRKGVLSVCKSGSEDCINRARSLAPEKVIQRDVRVSRHIWRWQGQERDFVLILIPPDSCHAGDL